MTLPEHEFTLYGKKFRMREPAWGEDADLAASVQTTKQLWERRITKSLLEPAMGVEDFRLLPNKVAAALIEKWIEYNEPKPADFLEPQTPTQKTSTS